jgi:hypothetical protein
MPDTSADYFTTANQVSPGFVWTDTANVLELVGFASSFTDSSKLLFDLPKAGAEIPAGQIITNIELTFNGSKNGATLVNGNFVIAGGATQQIVLTEPPISNQIITGDLDFWGITQQQAQDFANGVGGQTLVYTATGLPTIQTTCSYIRCMFTYEPEPSVIAPPVLF